MIRLSNTFRMGLALVAALAICLAPAAAATADKLVPENAEGIFHINFKTLADSGVVKKYAMDHIKAGLKSDPNIGTVLDQLGFDPLKDLYSITVAVGNIKVDPSGGAPKGDVDALAIIHGNFDVDKFQTAMAAHGLSSTKEGNYKIFETKGGNDGPGYIAFVDKNTVLGSNRKEVVAKALKGSATLNKGLATLVDKADDKAAMWGAMVIPSQVKDLAKSAPQGQGEIVDKLEGITGGLTIRDDAKLEIVIHTKDAAAAKQLKQQVEFGKGIGTSFIEGNPDVPAPVVDFLKSIQVTDKGNAVSIKAELTADGIEKLAKEAQKKSGK